jgi:hypothetical protein
MEKVLGYCGASLRPTGEGARRHIVPWWRYAIFLSTSAEFFEPKPTQLQMACSI